MEITFSSAAAKTLEDLKTETNAESIHQVVLEALMVYLALLDYKDEKNAIIIINDRTGQRFKLTLYPERPPER